MMTSDARKITHIITGLGTGGAERALYNLLASDFGKKYKCSVISLKDIGTYGEALRALDVPVYCLNIQADFSLFSAILKFRRIIIQLRPDVLQGWMYHGNLFAALGQTFLGGLARLAWNVRHSLYSLEGEKFSTRQVIRVSRFLSTRADLIFYNSEISRVQHEDFGFDSVNSVLNPNGFNTENLKPSLGLRKAMRRELEITDDQVLLGHVARYHPMKDHRGFIQAVVMVLRKHPALKVILVGREVEYHTAALLEKLSDNLIARIQFLGERADVYDLMQAMDILCLSSAWGEGFPNVLGEAMSFGTPCVTTDIADSAEIVAQTGLIVPPSDPTKLSYALLSLVELSFEERGILGKQARKRICERYSMQANTKIYETAYSKIL